LKFARYGKVRTSNQIRHKWEKLTNEFKKTFDYQTNKPSGQPEYFKMNSMQWKRFYLPLDFDHEVYNLLECWYPNQRAMNPDRSNFMDSSSIHLQEENATAVNTEPNNSYTTGNEENIAPLVNYQNVNPESHGRKKRTRKDQLDDHFSSASKDLLGAMVAENEQRLIYDQSMLEKMQAQIDVGV
jgi:hypothetical protein